MNHDQRHERQQRRRASLTGALVGSVVGWVLGNLLFPYPPPTLLAQAEPLVSPVPVAAEPPEVAVDDTPAPPHLPGAELRVYDEALPTTMNPLYARTMVDFRTTELVFDRLVVHSPATWEYRSHLIAESSKRAPPVHRLADPRDIKLVLREDVRWHDLVPFGPDDVCFTVSALLEPANPSIAGARLRKVVTGCEVDLDDYAVVLHFKRPQRDPLALLDFAILPAHAFSSPVIPPDHPFATKPIGTGPMRATISPKAVRFSAFEGHRPNARISTLTLQPGGDSYVQVRTLLNRGVDGIVSVPPPLLPMINEADFATLRGNDLRSWWFIALNTHHPALSDPLVRNALSLALDRDELRKLTLGTSYDKGPPRSELITGPFLPSSPYNDRTLTPIPHAVPTQVEALMLKAGANRVDGKWHLRGQPIQLKIGMNGPLDSEARDLINQVGHQLARAGFERSTSWVTPDDWNTKAVSGQLDSFDLLIGKWSVSGMDDVSPLFHTRTGDQGTLNIFNYSAPEVDALLERLENARTESEAQDIAHQLHAYLADDLPYLFLWKLDTVSAWRADVRGTIAPYHYFTEFERWQVDLPTAP